MCFLTPLWPTERRNARAKRVCRNVRTQRETLGQRFYSPRLLCGRIPGQTLWGLHPRSDIGPISRPPPSTFCADPPELGPLKRPECPPQGSLVGLASHGEAGRHELRVWDARAHASGRPEDTLRRGHKTFLPGLQSSTSCCSRTALNDACARRQTNASLDHRDPPQPPPKRQNSDSSHNIDASCTDCRRTWRPESKMALRAGVQSRV